jgi:hypothetical protein
MAARTGASVGVAVAITIFGIFAFAFFVLAMVFFGQAQSAKRVASEAEAAARDFVRDNEREQESVRQVRSAAERASKSVTRHLLDERAELMAAVVGSSEGSIEDVREKLAASGDATASSLFGLLSNSQGTIESLTNALAVANASLDNATARAEAEAAKAAELAAQFDDTGAGLRADVNAVTDSFGVVSGEYERLQAEQRARVAAVQEAAAKRERELQDSLAERDQQIAVLQDQVRRLRGEGAVDAVRPRDEQSLVDGRIDRVDDAEKSVILSIGRNQKVVLGMTFAVYGDATEIRESAEGEVTAPKGRLEVTRVEDNFARARILEESRGNPIARGDVIANAVYDPTKVYKFVVYGLFDRNGDGNKTFIERDDVAAIIERWGGTLTEELDGDADFLVLGDRPRLPPAPSATASQAEVNQYVRLQRIVQKYDDLLAKARSTSVPVLTENRLRTLIGDYPD